MPSVGPVFTKIEEIVRASGAAMTDRAVVGVVNHINPDSLVGRPEEFTVLSAYAFKLMKPAPTEGRRFHRLNVRVSGLYSFAAKGERNLVVGGDLGWACRIANGQAHRVGMLVHRDDLEKGERCAEMAREYNLFPKPADAKRGTKWRKGKDHFSLRPNRGGHTRLGGFEVLSHVAELAEALTVPSVEHIRDPIRVLVQHIDEPLNMLFGDGEADAFLQSTMDRWSWGIDGIDEMVAPEGSWTVESVGDRPEMDSVTLTDGESSVEFQSPFQAIDTAINAVSGGKTLQCHTYPACAVGETVHGGQALFAPMPITLPLEGIDAIKAKKGAMYTRALAWALAAARVELPHGGFGYPAEFIREDGPLAVQVTRPVQLVGEPLRFPDRQLHSVGKRFSVAFGMPWKQ